MSHVVTAGELLEGQAVLDIECLDRIYLSGFVNSLQTPGGVVYFLHNDRGFPVTSPAVFGQVGDQFRRAVSSYADANHIPVVKLRAADRNADVMHPYLDRAAAAGRSRVAAIGVAQEPQIVWTARQRDTDPGKPPQFSFTKETAGSPPTTSTCGMRTSAVRSSRSARTSPTRSRSGSTGTSGPSGRHSRPASRSPSCPTGSPPALTRTPCRRSATGCSRAPSRCSSPGGWPGSRSR